MPFCQGNGIDIGSAGDPVVPWAIQHDLPPEKFKEYGHANPIWLPVQWRSENCLDLPYKDGVLDFVYSSHLIEDFEDWNPVIAEWSRVLKPGGHLVILLPDHERFRLYVRTGGGENLAHKHESYVGELSEFCKKFNVFPVFEQFVNVRTAGNDYNICYVGVKR